MGAVRSTSRPSVLLTGAGGAAAVSFVKALHDQSAVLHMADMDACAAGLYLVGSAQRHRILPGADAGFVAHLLDICRRHAIDVLVPTVDAELLPVARARAQFASAGVRLMLAPEAALTLCVDKLALLRACDGIVPVGRYAPIDETFSADDWPFPFIVKPRAGSGSRGIQMIRTPDELTGVPRTGRLLAQEFLPGDEYSIDVLVAGDGRQIASVPRVRMKVDSGIAVTAKTVHDAEIEELGRSVAAHIGLRYTANVQVRRSAGGTPTLLEVNPRFPGTMPLTVHAGVNMPLLALRDVLGAPPPDGPLPFRDVAVVRYWAETFIEPAEIDALNLEMSAR
jgi:carbamoyl-phosphate synthase large subunit